MIDDSKIRLLVGYWDLKVKGLKKLPKHGTESSEFEPWPSLTMARLTDHSPIGHTFSIQLPSDVYRCSDFL